MGVGAKRHGGWRERKEALCCSRLTDVSELSSGSAEGGRGADAGCRDGWTRADPGEGAVEEGEVKGRGGGW